MDTPVGSGGDKGICAKRTLARMRGATCASCARLRGYTLHETLITLVIISVLIVSAVGFARLVRSTHISTQVNALVADLNLARSEAIKRAQPVTLCKSDSGAACNTDSAWHQGWLVITDANENAQLDGDDQIIKVGGPLEGGTTLTFSAWGPGSGKFVNYLANGAARQNGTFRICHSVDSDAARAVILIQAGRVRIASTGVSCP